MKNACALLISLLIQVAAAQQAPRASFQGTVTRLGTMDPVSKATVELRKADVTDLQPYTATTGTNGKFVFPNVQPGRYRIAVMRPGYVATAYGQRKANGPGEVLTLAAGQTTPEIQIALIPTGTISGRIYDKSGNPMGNVGVSAGRLSYQRGNRGLSGVQSTVTNDLGEYRLYWLPPGLYYVTATPPTAPVRSFTYGPDRFEDIYARLRLPTTQFTPPDDVPRPVTYPASADPLAGSPIDVRPGGEVRGIDIVANITDRAYRVRGTTINAETRQLVRAGQIALSGANSSLSTPGGDSFDLPRVFPGLYSLVATTADLSGRIMIEVRDRDLDNLVIPLGSGFPVSGRIIAEGALSTGGVPDLTALQLNLRLDVPVQGPTTSFAATPAADGSFALNQVLPGVYKVGLRPILNLAGTPPVIPPSLQTAYVKAIRFAGQDGLTGTLRIDGEPRDPIEIVLGMNSAQVEGRVVPVERQQPVAGITVVLVPNDLRTRPEFFKAATTNETGQFRFSAVPPGEYKVFAWEDVEANAWLVPEFLRTDEDRGKAVRLNEGSKETVEVSIIPPR